MADIQYQVYQRGIGWSTVVHGPGVCGQIDATEICAIRVNANENGTSIPISYAIKQEGRGWTTTVMDWADAGEANNNAPRIDRILISIAQPGYSVNYGVFSPGVGWLPNRKPTTLLSITIGNENAGSDNCWIKAIYVLLLPQV